MIDLYEYKQAIGDLKKDLDDLDKTLRPGELEDEIAQLQAKTEDVNFWNDPQSAQKTVKVLNLKREKLKNFKDISDSVDELDLIVELIEAGEDYPEATQALETAQKEMSRLKLETLLKGEYDANNAIISLHPGSGGTESNDWAEMLLRMYTRWAENSGYKIKTLDLQAGGVAGIKSATLLIEGPNAYGYLKQERGVHRLVRISPFDSSGRRHTSFASLDVSPEVDEDVEVDIDPDDLRIDTYRSSGAGGQHVNKTSSAIRITHLPTGIVVQCQNERSQHQNKDTAMRMLKSKLVQIMEEENKEKLDELKGDYGQITWGNQIRSYVFQPYTLVKDHRTGVEDGNILSVMNGALDPFINASLIKNAS